jgi:anti-sigma regulatory factor (Ser/Thr protein kinase)
MTSAFSHEALLYAGSEDFVKRTSDFVRQGLENDEPVLVMVTADKFEAIRSQLGADSRRVRFEDMGEVGRNPGRIISAWQDFADEFAGRERRRGIDEPIWAGRSADELVECQRNEALLNLAFADAGTFRLLCPYDVEQLGDDVIEEALRSHPHIQEGDAAHPSDRYRADPLIGAPGCEPLPEPELPPFELEFDLDTLHLIRGVVAAHGERAGLSRAAREELVLAVDAAASNSIEHGGGFGVLRIWSDPQDLVFEVRDHGRIGDPLAGRRRSKAADGGHGLWMTNQLCDLVQIRSLPEGTSVRLRMRRNR